MTFREYLDAMDCTTQDKTLACYDHIRDTYPAEEIAEVCGCSLLTAENWLGPFQSIADVLKYITNMKILRR